MPVKSLWYMWYVTEPAFFLNDPVTGLLTPKTVEVHTKCIHIATRAAIGSYGQCTWDAKRIPFSFWRCWVGVSVGACVHATTYTTTG